MSGPTHLVLTPVQKAFFEKFLDKDPKKVVFMPGRQIGKSFTLKAMHALTSGKLDDATKAFFETPGASTARWGDLQLKANLTKAQRVHGPPDVRLAKEMKEIRMSIEDEELDDQTDLEASLADLAADLTARYNNADSTPADTLGGSPEACTLLGPDTLTVELPNSGGYRKVAHMGGEDFIPRSAYLGKKRKILVVFKPVGAASYQTMEMPADEAITKLSRFEELSVTEEGSYRDRIREIARKVTKMKERASVKTKAQDYDDYGSF